METDMGRSCAGRAVICSNAGVLFSGELFSPLVFSGVPFSGVLFWESVLSALSPLSLFSAFSAASCAQAGDAASAAIREASASMRRIVFFFLFLSVIGSSLLPVLFFDRTQLLDLDGGNPQVRNF